MKTDFTKLNGPFALSLEPESGKPKEKQIAVSMPSATISARGVVSGPVQLLNGAVLWEDEVALTRPKDRSRFIEEACAKAPSVKREALEAALLRLCEHARDRLAEMQREARLQTTADADGLPMIELHDRPTRDIAADGLSALRRGNVPPRLFRYGGHPARLLRPEDGEDHVQIDMLGAIALRAELERAATWIRTVGFNVTRVPVPKEFAEDLLGARDWLALPPLRGITPSPCYTASGELVIEPGYHAGSGLYYQPLAGAAMIPPPPTKPSKEEIAAAASLISDTLIGEFPFAEEGSRAHAVALLVLPFVREMIDGPTPLHLIDAPTEGTGKSKLADTLTVPFTGSPVKVQPEVTSEAEWRKLITAILCDGPSHILFDNLREMLNSSSLAAVLTAVLWRDRILGKSRIADLPNRAVWMATGNNITASTEIIRRSPWIRLDAGMERPADRKDFKLKLPAWAIEHRAEIARAALTLIQAWIAAGKPAGGAELGSFEAWAQVSGGILAVAGIPGFLTNVDALYEAADVENDEWFIVVENWWRLHGGCSVTAKIVFEIAETMDLLATQIRGEGERGRQTSFGLLLQKKVGRIYEGKKIVRGCRSGGNMRYSLAEVP